MNPGVAYGATTGASGTSATLPPCRRLPDFNRSGLHTAARFDASQEPWRHLYSWSTASYTLQVTNVNTVATTGLVTVNDTVPLGFTPTSASGTGWTCSVSGQTVSCTRSDSLAGRASYPLITVNVNVSQSAPATITNTGLISGGGDISPLNDTAI